MKKQVKFVNISSGVFHGITNEVLDMDNDVNAAAR